MEDMQRMTFEPPRDIPWHPRLSRHLAACARCRAALAAAAPTAEDGDEAPAEGDAIVYSSLPSPLGRLWLAAGPRGLLRLDFATDELRFCCALQQASSLPLRRSAAALGSVTRQLAQYFAGSRTEFSCAVDLSGLSAFQRAVLAAVGQVPWGQVRSYGEIARLIGKPAAARAVGSAVATNPLTIVIPCHRIIRSDGTPGEYAWRTLGSCGVAYKLSLLALERVTFGSPDAARAG
jgi:methylated-DNA-[protein]-cysteine S-methyltransferase